jgi:hypothetical protein
MRRAFLYMSIAVLAVLSCTGKDTGMADTNITFSAEEGSTTRALLTDATLKTNGNKVHVIDLITGFTGSASWMSGNKYIDDDVVYSGAAVWGYDSGRIYPWTTDGTHQFFSWYSYDTAMNLTADSFFGSSVAAGFNTETRQLAIPAKELNTESPQFDFLYANTANYLTPHLGTDPVPLRMQHLFSALGILLRNESQDEILVHSVSITGLKNKKSANITFVGEPETTALTASASFIDNALYGALPAPTRTLSEGNTYDLLARVQNVETPQYRIIWPQTAADLAPSDAENFLTYPITVQYEYLNDEEHIQHTAHLRFPEGTTFRPGYRYAYTLLFTQKHIQLNFEVSPWNYDLNEWSFTEQTISEVTELDFAGNEGYDKPSKTCRIVGGNPVKGTFSIVNPSGAIWSIEPVGDVEYFTISPNQGIVDSEDSDYKFFVIPNLDPSLDRSTDKKLRFHFYVRFTDGSTHDANTEINRDNWTVILPKN